ncbi:Cytochrome O ubiquinol oxidase subunit II [Cupriavidus sp. U2]|uniref:ubiquinol oxidase subunit II n=1 Tax=Cupriavidus sp. U2 TaxID=2920269 RepID=UPI00129E976E|nr:ubiquinol oxidase subunit II [Cupriavidus sp. U2]KAI3590289.1 Cytochrome O ubiquinol oxidase subunit II [Cupriavidus sp. U2]
MREQPADPRPPRRRPPSLRAPRAWLYALTPLILTGCSWDLLNPSGSIGVQTRNLIVLATALMLLVVIPVIILTLVFAWRYRETNTKAEYAPRWSHSTKIEVVVWGIPCVIVALLGVIIWDTTHKLDPFRPLESKVTPVEVDVVALDWKWLFIYPQYGVASLNELPIPVGTPINFRITAESTMNALFIPRLGSMVYAMAGMQTKLHLIADETGVFDGRSAAYSGSGFSDMHFRTVATSRADFDAWIERARASGNTLDAATYRKLEQPSSKDAVTVYAKVEPRLFQGVVDQYMASNGDICRADSPVTLGAIAGANMPPLPAQQTTLER